LNRVSIVKIAATLAFACAATSAFAHAQLEKATPAVGGTVASASEIRLEFSEGVEPRFSPGAYRVHWHAVSVDTHHTQGTFEFTVK
jgi:copper resistance protein C